jgi:hypothetical protein
MAESGTALKFNSQKVSDKRMGAMAGREEGKKVYTRTDNPNEHAAMMKAFAVPSSGGKQSDPLPDGNLLGEHLAREELECPVHGKLFGMTGGNLSTDNNLPLDLLDDEIANSPVSQLANLRFHSLGQAEGRVEAVDDHGVTLQVSM